MHGCRVFSSRTAPMSVECGLQGSARRDSGGATAEAWPSPACAPAPAGPQPRASTRTAAQRRERGKAAPAGGAGPAAPARRGRRGGGADEGGGPGGGGSGVAAEEGRCGRPPSVELRPGVSEAVATRRDSAAPPAAWSSAAWKASSRAMSAALRLSFDVVKSGFAPASTNAAAKERESDSTALMSGVKPLFSFTASRLTPGELHRKERHARAGCAASQAARWCSTVRPPLSLELISDASSLSRR
jgi:hypothetical protein